MTLHMAEYADIRDKLQTGDLVFFSGSGLFSNTIKVITGSKWSHVGMVVRIQDIDSVLLWESTTLGNTPDVHSGELMQGVQLVTLSDKIKRYNGDVAFRLLHFERTYKAKQALMDMRYELRHRPYEQSAMELINSAVDVLGFDNQEDFSSCFCSEIVAEALQRMGVLENQIAANEFTVVDLANYPFEDRAVNSAA